MTIPRLISRCVQAQIECYRSRAHHAKRRALESDDHRVTADWLARAGRWEIEANELERWLNAQEVA